MQIIRRRRLGNDTEDITVLPLQLRGENVAVMDGYDVLALPLNSTVATSPVLESATLGSVAVRTAQSIVVRESPKLFDVLGLKLKGGPRGIAYVLSLNLFVFNDPFQPATLFLANDRGEAQRTITIQYLGGVPQAVEGLGYIPRNSFHFPDHIAMVASYPDEVNGIQARILVINFRGQVVKQIVPQGDIAHLFLTGVCFKAPGSLLLSSDDDQTIYEIDFDGRVLGSFVATGPRTAREPLLHGIEGLVQTAEGRVAAASGFDGLLVVSDLRPSSPAQVIDYRIGPGLSLPSGLAWNAATDEFLLISFDRQQPGGNFISALAPSLAKFATVTAVDNLTRKLTFIPDENLIAATHLNNPRGIIFFDLTGQPAGQIDTRALGTPQVISYIPPTREFVLVFRDAQDATKRSKLFVLSRQGAVSRVIDLAPAGVARITAAAFFNPQHPTGGQFFVTEGDRNTAFVTDFNGAVLDKFSVRDSFGLLSPNAATAITTGPEAGALALINGETSELVVFRLD